LLGKVIFPLLAQLWKEDRQAFKRLSGQTARSLWAVALPVIFVLCVESDRLLPLIYGGEYSNAATAQRLLTPCLATAFLHNLAAYAMIGMRRHNLLFLFYFSGLVVNIAFCFTLVPAAPLEGAALALTATKVWVAALTVSFFQWAVRPMSPRQWGLLLAAALSSLLLWRSACLVPGLPREAAEMAGLVPLLALLWVWRPPAPFERNSAL
jgi:O-antigen/teichoic acid export membrane protein